MTEQSFDVIVIGAGVVGMSAVRALHRRGVRRIALVEQFGLRHERGSSHGHTRITRSTYADPRYVELMQIARAEDWPALEHDAGIPLIYPTDGCFFGPAGPAVDAYSAAVAGCPDVQRLSPDEARRRFPAFGFDGMDAVFHDRTAGVIHASLTVQVLLPSLGPRLSVFEVAPVTAILPRDDEVVVRTQRGDLVTPTVIVAAGA